MLGIGQLVGRIMCANSNELHAAGFSCAGPCYSM
jgi:hypothetical protein